MICIIEPEYHAVWGRGRTIDEAWSDARKQIDWHKSWNKNCVIGKLEVARLREDANLDTDGETMYQWVERSEPVQESLF